MITIKDLEEIRLGVIKLRSNLAQQNEVINDFEQKLNDVDFLKARVDELGKIIQTVTGNGTDFDPYKTWVPGTEVHAGDWWMTEGGYLWQALKDGVPASETDLEYWDVVA